MWTLVLFSAAVLGVTADVDIGYENLWRDALDEVVKTPLTFTGTVPSYMVGSFMQTGPARWSWGNRKFTHALDGFSKVHKWDFKGGDQVLFTSKFLNTGFYQEAKSINDIPRGVTAQPTDPPLSYGMLHINAFADAPNDNNQVNVVQLGNGNFEVLSDTLSLVEMDESLNITNEYNGMQCKKNVPESCTVINNKSDPLGQMCAGGSAHPFITEDGDYIGLREVTRYTSIIPEKERFVVYRIKKDQRNTIQDMVTIDVDKTSYTHSFGLTKGSDGQHIIVVQQPIHYNAMEIALTGSLKKGLFKGTDKARFYVAPLEFGATAVGIDAPDDIFFGHQVNSFSRGAGKLVIDVNKQNNIFFDRYSLDVQLNKTLRDTWTTTEADGVKPGYQTVTRYEIDVNSKTVTSSPLFGHLPVENIFNEHDLFKLHPDDYGKEYCGYWAWQAYYNSTSFASWAVVRTELCGDKPTVAKAWYRPNVYPGEVSFVPKPGSTDKTEGALVFHAYDGNTDKTSLVIADAKSLATIAEAVLPVNIPFTVHGNWFSASATGGVLNV